MKRTDNGNLKLEVTVCEPTGFNVELQKFDEWLTMDEKSLSELKQLSTFMEVELNQNEDLKINIRERCSDSFWNYVIFRNEGYATCQYKK